MYHFEKKTLKNLEIFQRKKMVLFEKVTKKTNAPSSSFENFSLFLGKIWKSWKKKLNFFFFYIYMNKVHQMLHENFELKKT